ncbi:unnamed protein product, partial [Clonostachys rhizophaga]
SGYVLNSQAQTGSTKTISCALASFHTMRTFETPRSAVSAVGKTGYNLFRLLLRLDTYIYHVPSQSISYLIATISPRLSNMRVPITSFTLAWLVASVAASPVVDISAAAEEASPLEKRECSKAGICGGAIPPGTQPVYCCIGYSCQFWGRPVGVCAKR